MEQNQQNSGELPEKRDAQNNNGSEPDATRPVADANNQPKDDKKPRKTISEKLQSLLKDRAKLDKIIENMEKVIASARITESQKLLRLLGVACFKALAAPDKWKNGKSLDDNIRLHLDPKALAWYVQNSKPLLKLGLPRNSRKMGGSGKIAEPPSDSGNGPSEKKSPKP